MSSRIMVILTKEEINALNKIAEVEFRCPRDQIRVILKREFESLGLLPQGASSSDVEKNNNGKI